MIDTDDLQALIEALMGDGYRVIGPTVAEGAVVLQPIEGVGDLPAGRHDEQDGGRYRLVEGGGAGLFQFGPGPQSWKRYLYPATELLWRARRRGEGFAVEAEDGDDAPPRHAFIGVRACDLRAMAVHDRVLDGDRGADPRYGARRRLAFIVAVNCTRAGGTCFCASMAAGPKADAGFDLALTELLDGGRHEFLVEVGSERGAAALAGIDRRPSTAEDVAAADAALARTAAGMGREMIADVAALLGRNLEHPQWNRVAERCLACGNCTLVCPTCFCTTVEDVTDLGGGTAERWRRWDSCFTVEFSYVHGGSIRREGAARYRQWMTHKLSTWHQQFGSSGCVGCGRCITWCPVGIDITEEARAIGGADAGA
ncbi:MAG: 4Fe-4S dicluster domain-containing protein [Rhodospirillales bacterium]